VTTADIIEKTLKQHRVALNESQILLASPVRAYGRYIVPLSLEGSPAQLKIHIAPR